MASASPVCVPNFVVDLDGSYKCCNGPTKNMKVALKITDTNDCLDATSSVCVTDVKLGNEQPIGKVVITCGCGGEAHTVTVYLLDTKSCTVNLDVYYSVDGVAAAMPVEIQSGNISGGNDDGQCEPPTTP